MKLIIGAHEYEVVKSPHIDAHGYTDRKKNLITIDSNLPKDQFDQTLLHEILHCINNEFSETFVDGLAEQLYQVLHTNNLKF